MAWEIVCLLTVGGAPKSHSSVFVTALVSFSFWGAVFLLS